MADRGPAQGSGIDEARLRGEEEAFGRTLAADLLLPEALELYFAKMDGLIAEALGGGPAPACSPGCAVCCHQPLALSLVEAGALLFLSRQLGAAAPSRQRIEAEVGILEGWRTAGAATPRELAMRQFTERRPCLFLDGEGTCAAYDVRPVQCRNAFALERCSFSSLPLFGYGDLARLGGRLRSQMDETYGISARAGRGSAVAPWIGYLPEALAFLEASPVRADLEALYCPTGR